MAQKLAADKDGGWRLEISGDQGQGRASSVVSPAVGCPPMQITRRPPADH